VNTSSTSGLLANPGQVNYGAAKSGIATMTQIMAKELARYGVNVNAITPAARTRLTEATPGLGDMIAAPNDMAAFDMWDPANISPLVAYLSSAACEFTGECFFVQGGKVTRFQPWTMAETIDAERRWTVSELIAEMPKLKPGA
jgi:NAD(P)-dependent dehydrogenase (short-subunit alcohol dehydrogenase family)